MPEKPVYPKSSCCIAGCARWSRKFNPASEWICGRHWRTLRPSRRRALLKLWRRMEGLAGMSDKNCLLEYRLWRGAKREATLRAAGL